MAKARIILTLERDAADSGSGMPDLGHDAYYVKKLIEQDPDLNGKLTVVDIDVRQGFDPAI